MTLTLTVLFSVLLIFLVLSVPLYIGIGLSAFLALLVEGNLPLMLIPQRMYVAVDSFTLLAVPFFILAGDLMIIGGISRRLVAFVRSLLGWTRCAMAYATIVASALFGALSGSSVATTAAIGGFMYPEMLKDNYSARFAAGLGGASGILGILIPPSITFIVFGTQTGTSVSKLFLWGGGAGIIFALCFMLAAKCEVSYSKTATQITPFSRAEVWRSLKDAFWGLLCPVIILGGIYSGIFSPTEAAMVAILYALLIDLLIYKELTIEKFLETLFKSAISSATVMALICVASLFAWVMTAENMTSILNSFVQRMGLTPVMFLLSVNIIYLMAGMVMETIPVITLTSPLFMPIVLAMGIDPVHFGVITVCNLAIGLFTPPYGVNLFMATSYSGQSVFSMVSSLRFFYLFAIMAMMLLTYIPYAIYS